MNYRPPKIKRRGDRGEWLFNTAQFCCNFCFQPLEVSNSLLQVKYHHFSVQDILCRQMAASAEIHTAWEAVSIIDLLTARTVFCYVPVRYAVPSVWGQPAPSNRPPSSLSRWWTAKDSWSSASTAAESLHLVCFLSPQICNKGVPVWQKGNTVVIKISPHQHVIVLNGFIQRYSTLLLLLTNLMKRSKHLPKNYHTTTTHQWAPWFILSQSQTQYTILRLLIFTRIESVAKHSPSIK